jgi:hypothetical protein
MTLTLHARKGIAVTDNTPEQRSGQLGVRTILVGVDASDESRAHCSVMIVRPSNESQTSSGS